MNSVELIYQFAFTHLLVKGLRSPLLSSFLSMLSGTVSLATDIPWMVGECLCSWIVYHVTMFSLQMVKCIVNYRLHTTREKITAWTQATFYIFYEGKVGFLNVWLESSRISTWIIMYNYCVAIIRHIISFVLTNVHWEGHVPCLFLDAEWAAVGNRPGLRGGRMIQHFFLSVPWLKLNSASHSLFRAPSALLLLWKKTLWCLFLLHSRCVTPSTGRSEGRCRAAVAPHWRMVLLMDTSAAVRFVFQLRNSLSLAVKVTVRKLFHCWQILNPFPHTKCKDQRKRLQHWWCIKWAVTLQVSTSHTYRWSWSDVCGWPAVSCSVIAAENCTASLRHTATGASCNITTITS